MAMCAFSFTSCGDDDEEETPLENKTNNAFVGFWKILGVKKSTQKKGVDVYFVFMKNGKMRISTGDIYSSHYEKTTLSNWAEWSYNDKTKILATTAYLSDINFQWGVTLIGTTQWSGIGLWGVENAATVANQSKDYNVLLTMLLTGQKWVKEGDSSKKIQTKYESWLEIWDGNDESIKVFPGLYMRLGGETIYDKEKDMIFLNMHDHDPGYEKNMSFKLLHPFSLKDARVILENIYHYESYDGTYKLIN